MLDRVARDIVLDYFMEWAWVFNEVELKLLARGGNVALCGIHSLEPGRGRARRVMTEVCLWADCARVTLELTPSDQWGSDLERLTKFYRSLGFEPNTEPKQPLRIQEAMIRYPMRGGGHGNR